MEQSTLFFLLSLAAGIGYALQQTFLAPYSRKYNGLTVSIYRNGSFLITMLPFLFLAGKEAVLETMSFWDSFLLSGLAGGLGLILQMQSLKYLPVGIMLAFWQLTPLLLLLWSYLFLSETISFASLVFVFMAIIGAILLCLQKNHILRHIDPNFSWGIFLVGIGIIFGSFTYFFMSIPAKSANPFATTYFWEASVALGVFLMAGIQSCVFRKKITFVSNKEGLKIALAASPTLIGSGLIPLAISMGPSGIAQSISGSMSILVAIILSLLLFHEHLKFTQYVSIGIILIGVIGLRIFT